MTVTAKQSLIGLTRISPWRTFGNFPHELLHRIAATGRPVAHTNGPLSLWDRGTPDWTTASWFTKIEEIEGVKVVQSGRLPARWQTHKRWDELVLRYHGRKVRTALGMNRAAMPTVLLFDPNLYPIVSTLEPCRLLFFMIDAHPSQPGWDAENAERLLAVIRRADGLVVSGATLLRFFPEDVRDKVRICPAAVDAARIITAQDARCPADLASIPRPRIGYVGRVNPKVDFQAIVHTATRNPDWHWVIVGPISMPESDPHVREVQREWDLCRRLPNVHFLGPKRHSDVPAYLCHMDVNTICYRLSAGDWTRTAYPLKLHECLAVGRPVVSVWTEEICRHADVLHLVKEPPEWESALERAIKEGGVGSESTRRAVAIANSWDRRVPEFDAWLSNLEESSCDGRLVVA